MKKSVFALLFFLFCSVSVRAVIVYGGDGTQNTTAPADDPGWGNVGLLNGATGVYIGSYDNGYWVLTATHVGLGNITLGGTTYNAVGGSGVQVSGDLYAFRIATDPLLPNLTLSSVRLTYGSSTVLIGAGLNRAPGAYHLVCRHRREPLHMEHDQLPSGGYARAGLPLWQRKHDALGEQHDRRCDQL